MECTPALRAKFSVFAFFLLLVLGGCSDPATLGLELAPENNQIGVFYKEIPLDAQVVLLDSFNTTNAGILIVGDEEDPYFGKTRSTAYTRLYIEQGAERPGALAVLDSTSFSLATVSVNGSDLTKDKKFSVHLLNEPLLDTLYYNFNRLAYKQESIVDFKVTFNEVKDTILQAPLDPNFADLVFGKLKRGAEFDNLFNFRKFLPGVAIVPRSGDNVTAGFSLGGNTGITFYYHNLGDTTALKYSINTFSSRSFNGIESDRSGSPTEIVQDYQKSYSTAGIVGMKSGLGLAIRLNTKPLDAFLDTLSGIVFNQATLKLGPIEDQSPDQVPISGMVLKFVDSRNNVLLSSVTNAELHLQGDGQAQILVQEDGSVVPNYSFPSAAVMSYDSNDKVQRVGISSYLNSLYKRELERKDLLLYAITPTTGDDFKRSLRQFKVNKDKVVLTVIYSKTK
jgi:hypothetical protein